MVPVLLDFGLTKRFSPRLRRALAKVVVATAGLDYGLLLEAFEQMGVKMKRGVKEAGSDDLQGAYRGW